MKLNYLLSSIVLLCHLSILAQDDQSRSLKEIDKITQNITTAQQSDREKVRAIHSWIITNIRYDVKKYLEHDYTDVELDEIIRSKKAICYGYAKLFNAMCESVDIPSVTVNGYTKTFEVDQDDSFYIDQHSWNAVFIDSIWFLVDNTWDAGYTRYYRLTLASSVAFRVFKIPYIKSVYDPKFIQDTSSIYFLRSGLYFSTDHLPSSPMWQLMDEEISIDDFRLDSTFYYLGQNEDIGQIDNNSRERMSYYRMSDKDKLISSGRKVYLFNKLNQYHIALSYYLEAELSYNELAEFESEELGDYRRVESHLQQSILHADSMLYFLGLEYKSLNRNFKSKRAIQKNYTKTYNRYIERACKSFSTNQRKIKSHQGSIERELERLIKERKRQVHNADFEEAEFKHKFDAQDSFEQASFTDSVKREFNVLHQHILKLQPYLITQHDSFLIRFQLEKNYLDSVRDHFNTLFALRISGFDDYDYYVAHEKQRFNPEDSMLYFYKLSLLDSFKWNYKEGLEFIKEFQRTSKAYAQALKKLKRMQVNNNQIITEYDAMILEYSNTMDIAFEWMNNMISMQDEYNKWYKKISKTSCKTDKIVDLEFNIEQDKSPFKARIRAHKRLTKELQKESKRLLRKTERKIQKID